MKKINKLLMSLIFVMLSAPAWGATCDSVRAEAESTCHEEACSELEVDIDICELSAEEMGYVEECVPSAIESILEEINAKAKPPAMLSCN